MMFHVLNANETSFVAQCKETMTLFVRIEASMIDLELVCELNGRYTEIFWLFSGVRL